MEKVQMRHKVTAAVVVVAALVSTSSAIMQAGDVLSRQGLDRVDPDILAYGAAGALALIAIAGVGSTVAYALVQDDRDLAGLNGECAVFEASQLPPPRQVLTPVNRTTRIFSAAPRRRQFELVRSA